MRRLALTLFALAALGANPASARVATGGFGDPQPLLSIAPNGAMASARVSRSSPSPSSPWHRKRRRR
jgi:hypothetical protein